MSSNNNRNRNNQRPKGTTRREAVKVEAKVPADHREAIVLPEETDGWDLLKNPKKVRGSDQGRLLAALAKLGVDDMDEGDEMDPEKLDVMADFIDFISDRFANDSDEFDEWSSGPDGFQRSLDLAITYAGVLGEALRSKS